MAVVRRSVMPAFRIPHTTEQKAGVVGRTQVVQLIMLPSSCQSQDGRCVPTACRRDSPQFCI